MLLSWQSPRSAGIIKEQLITHNPLRARCLLCRSGRTVCVWAFVCRYLPPCFFSFLLFASPYMLVSSSCGEFCSPSVLLNRSLLLSSPLSDSLPTKSVHPSLHPSLPPPSLLPLTLSFRFILTWTRRESDLICCGLHSTESAVQSSCLSHLQVLCSDNIQRAFVCLGFTAILVALNATWYCCRLWAVFNWLLGDKRSFIVVWLLSGLSVNLLIWQESLFYNFQFEPGQLTLSLLVAKKNVLITWIHMTSPKSKSVAKCVLFLI